MTIIGLVIAIIVVGFVWWLIDQVPISPTFKKVAKGVLLFLFVLWVLGALGLTHHEPLAQPIG